MTKPDTNVLLALLQKEREERTRTRSYANITNTEELDDAMKQMASSSKAMRFLRDRIEKRKTGEEDTRPAYREVARICGIEVMSEHSEEDRRLFSEALIQKHARDRGFAFKDAQIDGLLTYNRMEGLFGPIGVGHGKTFIAILIAALAYERGNKRTVMLVPPEVYEQLTTKDIPQARRDLVLFGLPFHYLGGQTRKKRKMIVDSRKRGCYIMPYSLLSTTDTAYMLDKIKPEVIIADEAHCLKNFTSARTKRMKSYVDDRDPHFVALSGTITNKTVMDYWHLFLWCCGPGATLPLTNRLAMEWAVILDSETLNRSEESDTGPLMPLIKWAKRTDPKGKYDDTKAGFRKAYALRLKTAPGVVKTEGASCDASIVIMNEFPGKPGVELDLLMTDVSENFLTPQGEAIEFGMHKHKWLFELSAGFWNKLVWPEPEKYARTHRMTVVEASERIERAMEHHEAYRLYAGELSRWLRDNHIKNLDTPMLVASHILNHYGTKLLKVPGLVAALYMNQRELDFEGRPKRVKEPIRVDPYKIDAAVRWAKQHKEGVIWYANMHIGVWLTEALREAGLDPLHCPAGPAGNVAVADSEGRLAVASIWAHRTGKNLQFHQNQLVVQWLRGAGPTEQMLGRLHRLGQQADSLTVHTNHANVFDDVNLAACMTDALYIHQSGGGTQKLVIAAWNPLPKTMPRNVMIERGIDPDHAAAAELAMAKFFGKGA